MTRDFIPFANPQAAYTQRAEEIQAALTRVLESGVYILGEEVAGLEREFSAWLNSTLGEQVSLPPHTLGVANGTDALELALRGFFALNPDIAPCRLGGHSDGTAVFAPSHTAVATVSAIERAGAIPVLVDIDPLTLTLSPSSLAGAVDTARLAGLTPAAVIAVHIYGHPCHMRHLELISQDAGLWILEDCAQAHGALYQGRMVGTLAEAAAFSCYPTKNLGALGDAGLVSTAFAPLAEEMEALRQYGWKARYISSLPGINTRLDPLQAAVLRVNLRYLDDDLRARRAIAAQYTAAFADTALVTPHTASWAEHAFHLYVIRVPRGRGKLPRRDALMNFLRERGIGAALHYPQPVHTQPAYKDRVLLSPDGLPETQALYEELLTLPLYPQMTQEAIERVIDGVRQWQG